MGKQYNTELQAKVETYMKETGISQAKLAPMMNLSGAVLSQYRRSVYYRASMVPNMTAALRPSPAAVLT